MPSGTRLSFLPARVYGHLQQTDRSGLVSVRYDEVELLDGAGKKIEAATGLGSILAEVAGNNTSSEFSEDDMLRERLAENIGTAGDAEVMSLNANSRIVVSVPAGRRIYVVFTRHEASTVELRKAAPDGQ